MPTISRKRMNRQRKRQLQSKKQVGGGFMDDIRSNFTSLKEKAKESFKTLKNKASHLYEKTKSKINELLGSNIKEIKQYEDY